MNWVIRNWISLLTPELKKSLNKFNVLCWATFRVTLGACGLWDVSWLNCKWLHKQQYMHGGVNSLHKTSQDLEYVNIFILYANNLYLIVCTANNYLIYQDFLEILMKSSTTPSFLVSASKKETSWKFLSLPPMPTLLVSMEIGCNWRLIRWIAGRWILGCPLGKAEDHSIGRSRNEFSKGSPTFKVSLSLDMIRFDIKLSIQQLSWEK